MITAEQAARLQAYLRAQAQRGTEPVAAGPFSLFLQDDATEAARDLAIPDTPSAGTQDDDLTLLHAAFTQRGRRPRIAFVEEFAPNLMARLHEAGYFEERRSALLVCTPEDCRPIPNSAELQVVKVTAASSLAEVRENLDTNERGFNPDSAVPATDADAAAFRAQLVAARGFTARLDGQAVGAGLVEAPVGGVAELVGITTLAPFRRRGVATILTAAMVRAAFAEGLTLAFRRTSDPGARRAYGRVGFRQGATLLTFAAAPMAAAE